MREPCQSARTSRTLPGDHSFQRIFFLSKVGDKKTITPSALVVEGPCVWSFLERRRPLGGTTPRSGSWEAEDMQYQPETVNSEELFQ